MPQPRGRYSLAGGHLETSIGSKCPICWTSTRGTSGSGVSLFPTPPTPHTHVPALSPRLFSKLYRCSNYPAVSNLIYVQRISFDHNGHNNQIPHVKIGKVDQQ